MAAMQPPSSALYTAAQVRDFDRVAIHEFGIPGYELMSRAGRATLAALRSLWPAARSVTVLCGPGNNGGDGYVVAREARASHLGVTVVALGDPAQLAASPSPSRRSNPTSSWTPCTARASRAR
jgi:NAD(P)H-hydrate epimerase